LTIGAVSAWAGGVSIQNTINGTGSITNNGTITATNGAILTVGVTVINNAEVNKSTGNGILTFTNSFTMTPGSRLNVDSGTLSLNGNPLNLVFGSELSGAGTFFGNVVSNGGIIDIGNDIGDPGILDITGTLTLDQASTVVFDLAGNTTQGADYDLLRVSGNVFLDGSFAAVWDNNFVAVDTDVFDLITTTGGSFSGAFDSEIVPVGVLAYTLDNAFAANTMRLATTTVVAASEIIFWSGVSDSFWDIGANWVGGAAPTPTQYAAIEPDFDITVTVRNAATVAGLELQTNMVISGTGALTINGSGVVGGDNLLINTTGGLTSSGSLVLVAQSDLTAGTLSASAGITIHNLGSLSVNGGTLSGGIVNSGVFNLNVGNVTSSISGIAHSGEFNLTAGTILTLSGFQIFDPGTSFTGTGTLVAGDVDINTPLTFPGALTLPSGGGMIVFADTTVLGAFTQDDAFVIIESGATLSLNGAPLLLTGLSSLEGVGTFSGNVITDGGLIVAEDDFGSPGTLTIDGSLTLDPKSIVVLSLAGNTQGVDYSFLNVSGNIILDGSLAVMWDNQFTAASTNTFDLIQTGGAFSGAFANQYMPTGITTGSFNFNTATIMQLETTVVSTNIKYWTAGVDGDWNIGGNWTGGTAPGVGDFVILDDDTLTITISDLQSIAGLESHSMLVLNTAGDLTLANTSFIGGDLFTPGSFTIGGSGGLTANADLVIATSVFWTNGDLGGSGNITVYPIGTINIFGTAGNLDTTLINNSYLGSNWGAGAASGSGSLENNGLFFISDAFTTDLSVTNNASGLLVKTDPGVTTFNAPGVFTNDGLLEIQAGSLFLQASTAHGGDFDIFSGATLDLSAASSVHTSAGIIRGNGTVITTNATFTSTGVIRPGGFDSIGTLSITGDLFNSGNIEIGDRRRQLYPDHVSQQDRWSLCHHQFGRRR